MHEDKDLAPTLVETVDPDIVNWDGPDDPENPLNWPAKQKWMNIGLLSAITLLTLVPSESLKRGIFVRYILIAH